VATTQINWNWGTDTSVNFNATTDILDFGWFQADQFTISELNGTVVIAIPSNHQTYTLQHTTLGALSTGSRINLEIDLIARYVERMLTGAVPRA